MTDRIRVNNTIYSWTSSVFRMNGVGYVGISSFEFSDKRERKIVHGAKRDGTPIGKTAGKYIPGLITMKVLKDTWHQKMKVQLAALGQGSYGDAEFVMSAQFVEEAVGSIPISMFATGCTVEEAKEGHDEGTDELVVDVTIQPLYLVSGGLPLYSLIRGLPV